MTTTNNGYTVKSHFEGKSPAVRETYEKVLQAIKVCGRVTEDPKKTSIHLVNVTTLAGVAIRMDYLILTIKSDRKLTSPRIIKSEQTSPKRYHHDINLASPTDVTEDIMRWLRDAYALSA
jgi:Domain of unknown function (DUF5655)